MQQNRHRPGWLANLFGASLIAASTLVAVTAAAPPAQAAVPLTVAVTIVEVQECCGTTIDGDSGADFFGSVTLGAEHVEYDWDDDEDAIFPNTKTTTIVDDTTPTVAVRIDIWDFDPFDPNDHVDVVSGDVGDSYSFDATIDLHSPTHDCAVNGDNGTGFCNQVIETHGNSGGEQATLKIRVEVVEPPQAPGLHAGCMHTALWPQPGQQVTITADAFGDQPDGQALPTKLADRIEIWVSTDGGATKNITATTGQASTLSVNQTAGGAGSTLSYGCRVVDDRVPIFSGWKTVQVGDPPQGQAVPVLLAEQSRQYALDMVLFPVTVPVRRAPLDPNDLNPLPNPVYGAPNDPNFLNHAMTVVNELFREQTVIDQQRAVNIWIARDGAGTGGVRDLRIGNDPAPDTTGDGLPDGDGTLDECQIVPPANLDEHYGWANARGLLHPATLRDCASGGFFSAEAGEANVFVHETGHAGWGLADEYCCDGGYEPPPSHPNVYDNRQACLDDVGSLGGIPTDCRGMDSVHDADTNPDFWVSDPAANDLMADNGFARRADRRRMLYVFQLCGQGRC